MTTEFLYGGPTVLLILTAITFLGVWLDANSRFFKQLGSAALIILMGMILSNTGILPPESDHLRLLFRRGDPGRDRSDPVED